MKRPSHTKTGRKISENLTDYEACFAEWFSGDGKSLVKEGSITDAQKFLFLMEKSFIAGMKCHLAAHDAEVAAKAVINFAEHLVGIGFLRSTYPAEEYTAKLRAKAKP